MSDQSFDDILKKRLEAHKTNKAPDWTAFKKRLDQDNDAQFDAMVSDKLNAFSTSSQPQWEALSLRYNHFRNLKRHIRSVKLVESVCMLLLIVLFNTIDFQSLIQSPIRVVAISEGETNTTKDSDGVADLFKDGSVVEETFIDQKLKSNVDVRSGSAVKNNIQEEQAIKFGNENANVKNEDSGVVSDREQTVMTDQVQNSEGIMAGAVVSVVEDQSIIVETQPSAISKKHFNSVASLQDDTPFILGGFAYVDSKEIIPAGVSSRSLKFIAAFDNNQIFTPEDLAFNTSARKTEMYGYSLGLLFGKKKGKIELETGLTYSALDKPWNFNLQYGNAFGWYSFMMTNIHYDIINVPIQINYHLIENPDWSIYVTGGMTHSMVMQSEYTTTNMYLGGGALPVGTDVPNPEDMISPFEEQRHFNKGLAQGGSLSDNYFIRFDFGAGIQRNIAHGLSINFSGVASRAVYNTSIGPNNDRLDRFSVVFGLKQSF